MRGPPRKSVVLFLAASWLRRARASFVAPRTMTRRRPSLLAMLLLESLIPPPLPWPSARSAAPHLIPCAAAADAAGRRRRREKETPRKRKRRYDDDEQEEGGDGLHLSFDALFVTRKPRDALEGARAALSNACRGAFYGLVALFAAPVAGLKAGPAGAAAGLAAGVVAAPLLSLVGVAVGGFQLLRGITETPTAILDGFLGCQRWNETARAWQEYRLDEDAAHIDAALHQEEERRKSEERTPRRQGRRRVQSTEYYDLLGVAPDAAPSALRSAYRSKARQVHPDKNPGDPAAAARFRELSAAYQTLSDPARRKEYDASGVGADANQGMAGISAFDPTVFFAVLFGAEAVEPYVGELWMATAFDALFKLGNGTVSLDSWEDVKTALGWSEEALKRRKREANIAAHLRARVADYADELLAHDAFRDSCREEAKEIAAGGSYGAEFLLAIGPAVSVRISMLPHVWPLRGWTCVARASWADRATVDLQNPDLIFCAYVALTACCRGGRLPWLPLLCSRVVARSCKQHQTEAVVPAAAVGCHDLRPSHHAQEHQGAV